MEIQLNLDQHQAIKNLTRVGIDEEQAVALVSTFGGFSEKIATKDDLAVVKQELTQEMKAMETRQSQKSDYLEKTLVGEIAKSRYIMFAVMVAVAAIVLTLHEALERFLN